MKKRVLSIIITFAVSLGLFGGLGALGYAENTTGATTVKTNPVSDSEFTLYNPSTDADKFTIALDDAYGSVGDTVEFSSYIKNNTGLYTAAIYLKYDSDVLSPVLVSAGSDMIVSTKAGTVLSSATSGVEKEVVDDDGNKLGYKIIPFVLENSGMKDSTKNGVLFTIKFEIIAKPEYGDTTNVVFANYAETMFTSLEGLAEPVFDEGSVTVGKEAPTTEKITSEQTTTTNNDATAANTTNTSDFVHAESNPVSDSDFTLYNAATDADKFTVALDDVSGAIGEIVDFSVTIKNNSGLFSTTLSLKYDSGVLRPIVKTSGQDVVADAAVGTVLPALTTGPINDVTDEDGKKLGYQIMPFIFENTGLMDSSNNGILVTVKFEIISKPTYGDTTSVVFTDYDNTMFTSLEEILEPVYDEGSVTVTDTPRTTVPPTTTVSPTTTASPTSTVIPSTSAVIPPVSAVVPPTSAVVPPTSAVVPPTSAVVPPTSDLSPIGVPTTTAASPTTVLPTVPDGMPTTVKHSNSVDIIQPEKEYGSISKTENNDGSVTLSVNPNDSVTFESWVIDGNYEIINGSLSSLSITIMPKSDAVTVNALFVETESDVKYGDADSNSEINMLDVLLIRKYIAKQPVTPNLTASDVNCDDSIDMLDVLLIRKYIAKQPVILGPKG